MAKKKTSKKTSAKKTTTALAKSSDLECGLNFLILSPEVDDVHEIVTANLGAVGLDSPSSLERVKIPTGGGTKWSVPRLEEGEEDLVDEIVGVIVAWQDVRVFWADDFSGPGTPPDCFSDDCVRGQGDPGGACQTCPNSDFNTAKGGKGRGQACKQIRRLFILREEDALPIIIACPPSSIGNIRKYLTRLAGKMVRFCGVVTSFKLERDKNADGIEYSKVVPTMVEKLPKEMTKKFQQYGNSITPAVERLAPTGEDVVAAEGDGEE